jgi:hypothetical protein
VNVVAAVRAGNSVAIAANGEILIAPLSSLQPWSVPTGSVSAVSAGVQKVDLPVNAISALRGTAKLLLATPSAAGSIGNAILTFNPNTNQIENTIFIGSEPSILSAAAADGSAVYAYFSGEYNIARLNVRSGIRDLVFTTDPTGSQNQFGVTDMAAGPAGGLAVTYPGTVAVGGLLYTVGVDGTIAMFDNGILCPKIDPNSEGRDAGDPSTFELAFNDTGSILYAYNSFLSSFELKRESVSPQGVQWLSTTEGLLSGYNSTIRYAQGLLYTSRGDVIDPERSLVVGQVRRWLAN